MYNLLLKLVHLGIITHLSNSKKIKNYFYVVNNLETLQKELGFSIISESDYYFIGFKEEMALVPITEIGANIVNMTFHAIEKITDCCFIKDFSRKTNNYSSRKALKNIQDTYLALDMEQLNEENIIIFNKLENFTLHSELNISLIATLEPLLKVLNYSFSTKDIKRLSSDIAPIIFPIRERIRFSCYTCEDLSIAMLKLVTTGFFKANGSDISV